LERVKGIEPSYSAWKSPNFTNVFTVGSDKSRPSGQLRSLQNFSQSEWPIALRVATVRRRETNLATDTALTPDSFRDEIWKTKIRRSVSVAPACAFSATASYVRCEQSLPGVNKSDWTKAIRRCNLIASGSPFLVASCGCFSINIIIRKQRATAHHGCGGVAVASE
jgi:hypothetical protein